MDLKFGATADKIAAQLHEQGYSIVKYASVEPIQRAADAVTYLHVHGYLSDGEARKARRRILLKTIEAMGHK